MLKQNRKLAIVRLVVANVGHQMGISPNITNYFCSVSSNICGQLNFLDAPIFPTAEFYLPKLEAIFNLESYWEQAASCSNSYKNFTVAFRVTAAFNLL